MMHHMFPFFFQGGGGGGEGGNLRRYDWKLQSSDAFLNLVESVRASSIRFTGTLNPKLEVKRAFGRRRGAMGPESLGPFAPSYWQHSES